MISAPVANLAVNLVTVAHELTGLGSTRVVRFCALRRSRDDEPDDVATGPQDAEVSRCFEPLGEQGTVGDGSRGDFGVLGTTVPTLPDALRGGGACRAGR